MSRTANKPTRSAALERRRREAAERQAAYDALPQSERDKRNPRKGKGYTVDDSPEAVARIDERFRT